MIDDALELARAARAKIKAIPGMACAGREIIGRAGIHDLDETRLTVSAAALGITGFELKRLLFDEYNIDMEQANYHDALAIVTFANRREDLDRLTAALGDIARRFAGGSPLAPAAPLPPLPEYVISPREAYFSPKKRVTWADCRGRICGEMIAPYPPRHSGHLQRRADERRGLGIPHPIQGPKGAPAGSLRPDPGKPFDYRRITFINNFYRKE